MSESELSKRLRAPSAKGDDIGCRREVINSDIPLMTPEGKPTFAAVYRAIWMGTREERNLKAKTSESYESVMESRFLPLVKNLAFEDMTEEDLLEAWGALRKSGPPEYVTKQAAIVIRAVMEEAHRLNLTQVILEDVPQCKLDAAESGDRYAGSANPWKEGVRLATLGVRIKRAMHLKAELRLAKLLLENCEQSGELLGALIMLFLGVRTSEATGFSWKHLREMSPGYWALIRYDVSEKDSRKARGGGKTNNAFRILPVPAFLAEVLCRRKEALLGEYSKETVMNLPIACKGTDHTCRCTQKELNRSLKWMYKSAGVDEGFFANAYQDMEENSEMADDCEKSVTAYLCRHMFATAMVYCGLTLGEIYTLMGHKEEDENVQKADFSNPDKFRELADKMSRRPTTQILDHVFRSRTYAYCGGTKMFADDGDMEVCFEKAAWVRIIAEALEAGEVPQIFHDDGFVTNRKEAFLRPRKDVSDVISLRTGLWDCGMKVWEEVKDDHMTFQAPRSVIDFVESALEAKAAAEEAAAKALADQEEILPCETHEVEMVEEQTVAGNEEVRPEESCTEDTGGEPAPDERSDNLLVERGQACMTSKEDLYLLDDTGRLRRILHLPVDQRRDRRGVVLADAPEGGRIIVHNRSLGAYVLSREGTLFRIPAGKSLETVCDAENASPILEALRFGGVLFQNDVAAEEGAIICLANTGKMRRFDLSIIKRVSHTGRQLVTLLGGEEIVSACICRKDGDVLLLTQGGMGLRLEVNSLPNIKGAGCQMIAGVELTNNDAALVCVPYMEDEPYLFFKSGGGTVRWDNTFSVKPHGRGSQGVCCVKVEDNDRLIGCVPAKEYVLTRSDAGMGLCFKTDEVRAVSGPALGVRAMKLLGTEKMVSAVSIDCTVQDCAGGEEKGCTD